MKRIVALGLVILLITAVSGCRSVSTSATNRAVLSVGMVTDSGKIDDGALNQGTWEGLQRSKEDFNAEIMFVQSREDTSDGYNAAIDSLVGAGYNLIICPGGRFGYAVYQAQEKYPGIKFALLDGVPNNNAEGAGYEEIIANNCVSVVFAEHEAGFLAGLACALELKAGKLGFIGSMDIPSVQLTSRGFINGVRYSNETYGTTCETVKEDSVYLGGLSGADSAVQYAAAMYDRGVKAIFVSAGNLDSDIAGEAASRRANGGDVWYVGANSDQYNLGGYGDDTGSAVLTSAAKEFGDAAYGTVRDVLYGNFQGGKQQTFNIGNGGIALPDTNPNLSEETIAKVNETTGKIKDGSLTVPDCGGDI